MKMKAGFSLEEITIKRIDVLAAGTRRDKSAIIDIAIEQLAARDEFSHLQLPIPQQPRKRGKPAKQIQPSAIPGVRKGLPEAA